MGRTLRSHRNGGGLFDDSLGLGSPSVARRISLLFARPRVGSMATPLADARASSFRPKL